MQSISAQSKSVAATFFESFRLFEKNHYSDKKLSQASKKPMIIQLGLKCDFCI